MAETPTFSLKVIASNKVFYDGPAEYLQVITLTGSRGFMAHHAPCIVAVETGTMSIVKPGGERETVVVSGGICSCAVAKDRSVDDIVIAGEHHPQRTTAAGRQLACA